MPPTPRFHLVYQPAESTNSTDRIVRIVETDDPNDLLLEVKACPGSIAMQLEAHDREEIPIELAELGF